MGAIFLFDSDFDPESFAQFRSQPWNFRNFGIAMLDPDLNGWCFPKLRYPKNQEITILDAVKAFHFKNGLNGH